MMSVVDNLTLEKAVQALDKVKADYEKENEQLVMITPDLYNQTYDIMGNHFKPDEPLAMVFGDVWSKEMQAVTLKNLQSNVSICMIAKETNAVMGVHIINGMKASDPKVDVSQFQDEALKGVVTFLANADDEINFYQHYGVDETAYFFALGVHKEYRRRGIGGRLLAAAVAMCRILGFKAIKSEGTSIFSQRIFEKQGFETLHTMPYDSYMNKGRPIREGTKEHTKTNIYGLRL